MQELNISKTDFNNIKLSGSTTLKYNIEIKPHENYILHNMINTAKVDQMHNPNNVSIHFPEAIALFQTKLQQK